MGKFWGEVVDELHNALQRTWYLITRWQMPPDWYPGPPPKPPTPQLGTAWIEVQVQLSLERHRHMLEQLNYSIEDLIYGPNPNIVLGEN